jgi:predicted AAA+ superfamily ATPase
LSTQKKIINQTFSIPIDVLNDLHTYIKKRKMSHFVTEAIRKELSSKKELLKAEYLSANEDAEQIESVQEWSQSTGMLNEKSFP